MTPSNCQTCGGSGFLHPQREAADARGKIVPVPLITIASSPTHCPNCDGPQYDDDDVAVVESFTPPVGKSEPLVIRWNRA